MRVELALRHCRVIAMCASRRGERIAAAVARSERVSGVVGGCRLEGLAHAADVRARGGGAEPAPLQAVRQGGDAHPQPLPCALPGAVRVPAVPRHIHALRQPAHALQVQASRVQPRHAQVRAPRAAAAARARAATAAPARADVRQPPGRGFRLIVHVLARLRRSVSSRLGQHGLSLLMCQNFNGPSRVETLPI